MTATEEEEEETEDLDQFQVRELQPRNGRKLTWSDRDILTRSEEGVAEDTYRHGRKEREVSSVHTENGSI
jgi:hypothetical protein